MRRLLSRCLQASKLQDRSLQTGYTANSYVWPPSPFNCLIVWGTARHERVWVIAGKWGSGEVEVGK